MDYGFSAYRWLLKYSQYHLTRSFQFQHIRHHPFTHRVIILTYQPRLEDDPAAVTGYSDVRPDRRREIWCEVKWNMGGRRIDVGEVFGWNGANGGGMC